MPERHHERPYRTARTAVMAVAILLAGSIVLLWSWNTLAVDLFELPEARFKHAAAVAALIAAALLVQRFAVGVASGDTPPSRLDGDGVS